MPELSNDALLQTFAPIAPAPQGAPSNTPPTPAPPNVPPVTNNPVAAALQMAGPYPGDASVAKNAPFLTIEQAQPMPHDRSALNAIASGVEFTESKGANVKSPKGAIGPRQIEPSTFSEFAAPGQKIDNPTDNREVGNKILGHLFDKYGNWENALIAYNWGEARTDKWIAAGSNQSKLPAETRAYVPEVLRHAGVPGAVAGAVLTGKRELSADDIQHALTVDTSPEPMVEAPAPAGPAHFAIDPYGLGIDTSDPEQVKAFGETNAAIGAGFIKGLKNTAVGVAQAVTPDALSNQITALNNRLDSALDQPINQHPVLGGIGELLGTTTGIMAGSGALGAAKGALPETMQSLIARFTGRMGIVGRSAAAGAAAGALTYNKDPENASRVAETVLGGAFGALGGTIGKAVISAGKSMADRGAYSQFIAMLKSNVAGLTPSTSALRDKFVSHYASLETEKTAKYTLRNAAGRELTGFEYDPMSQATRDAISGIRGAGVAPTATTRAVAAQVDRELGGDAQRAAKAAHDNAVAQAERATANLPPIAGVKPGDPRYAGLARAAGIEAPIVPPFDPAPVTSDQFSTAVQAVNRAITRAKADPTTRTQLMQIKSGLMDAASATARDAGMNVSTFLRRSDEAAKFMREQIGPVRDMFQGRTPAQIVDPLNARAITPAAMFDRATKVIEGGDKHELERFARIMGPAARDDLVNIAAFRALTADTNKGAAGMRDYIQEHVENLQVLLGRERMTDLRGMSNIAQRLADPKNHPMLDRLLRSSHGIATSIGLYEIARGGLQMMTGGSGKPILEGATMIAAPVVLHAIAGVLQKVADIPGAKILVRRIGKLRVGSAEMDMAVRELERRFVRWSAAAGQTVGAPIGNVGAPVAQGLGSLGSML